MPRIPAALTLAATVVFCIGFNTVRYPVVRQMLMRPALAAAPDNPPAAPKDEPSHDEDAAGPEPDSPAQAPNRAAAIVTSRAAGPAALAIRANPPAGQPGDSAPAPKEKVVCANNVCMLAGTVQPASPETAALAKTETSPATAPAPPAAPPPVSAMPAHPPEMRCAMVPVRHDGLPPVAEADKSFLPAPAATPAGPATSMARSGKLVRHLPAVDLAATAEPVSGLPLDGALPIYPMTRNAR